MTNEELKEKICDIIAPYVSAYGDDERIADALIAAGIGDVSELKKHRVIVEQSPVPTDDNCYILPNTSPIIKQLYSGKEVEQIAKERDEYKHRAEVAERALQIADELGELCGRKEDYVQQAEKELAEENDGKKEV